MSSFTDPKGVKATVEAIYMGGQEHPLADLARAIEDAIREGSFQGLSGFNTARWVAHVVSNAFGTPPIVDQSQQPRELTTYDGIESLPNGSVILDRGGVAWQRLHLMREKAVWYPATVDLGARHSGGLFDRSPFIVLREGNAR